MEQDDELGPGQTHWLASSVADGTAKPEEARQLIEAFVRQADAGSINPRLIGHVRDCFAAFLAGEKTLDPMRKAGRDKPLTVPIKTLEKAFGLTRTARGHPPLDDDVLIDAAADLLEKRLAGRSRQEALVDVAEERRRDSLPIRNETEVGAAWAAHKRDALVYARVIRHLRGDGWTDDEIRRLCEIYADVPGIVLPGEKPFEGRHALPD